MDAKQPSPQSDSAEMQQDRPEIDNVGKAIANDALVYYLIKQLHNHGGLSSFAAKISEMSRARDVSIDKILEPYGPRAIRLYGDSSEVKVGFDKQLNHLKRWILPEEGNPQTKEREGKEGTASQ